MNSNWSSADILEEPESEVESLRATRTGSPGRRRGRRPRGRDDEETRTLPDEPPPGWAEVDP